MPRKISAVESLGEINRLISSSMCRARETNDSIVRSWQLENEAKNRIASVASDVCVDESDADSELEVDRSSSQRKSTSSR